ncbi:MAG TPA: ribosome maturation factor RimM [Burkholderiales bacterium]|nr:ribosome maturation factor RimM [Burkholderiales bacterium]
MGRISAPFGVKGWVKVQPNTAAAQNLLAYKTWWLEDGGEWHDRSVAQAKVHGRTLVAKLDGCEDRDAAIALRGKTVAVPRTALPGTQSGEYYWADLIGLAVVNGAGQTLGRIAGLLQTGANDVLVVAGERERLIPFIADVIRDVDFAAGVMQVEWGADY